MAITANPAFDTAAPATSLDSFLHKDANSIGAWADQCDNESCSNSMHSEDTCDSSFGADNSEGWSKVKSKSERLESRNAKPYPEDRFPNSSNYRYKTSQYFASRYMQQRKYTQDSFPIHQDYSPKPNQCICDLQSNSESGESEVKHNISKEKPEFVDAPVPKVNPWLSSKRTSKYPFTPILSPAISGKKSPKSSPKLPTSCSWGKHYSKDSNISVTKKDHANQTTPESPLPQDQQTWPSLKEVSSPKSTISHEKHSPESQSSFSSASKVAKKKTKQRTKSDRNKSNNIAKLDLNDSDSSKENADSPLSTLAARRKKVRQRWTALDVDVKPMRREFSHPGFQRNKCRPKQFEREYNRSYSNGNGRSIDENDIGPRRWNNSNRGRFNKRRAKGRGRGNSRDHESYEKLGTDGYEAFDEFHFVNKELPPSQLVIFDGYPQCAGMINGDVQVFIPDENFPPTIEYVQWQIEYYFSPSNLNGDFFLRQHMDKNGFVPISLITSFRAIQNLTSDPQVVFEAAKGSSLLEVVGDKVRCKKQPEKWVMSSDQVEDCSSYNFVLPSYDLPIISPDSEEQFSSVSYDSACYVLDETLCQYQASDEVSEDLLARSEMWKWVNAPVFIPKKSGTATQETEKLSHSELSGVDDAAGKQSDSGMSGSIASTKERRISSSLPDLKTTCEGKLEKNLSNRLRKASLEHELPLKDANFPSESSPSRCKSSPTSKHRQFPNTQI